MLAHWNKSLHASQPVSVYSPLCCVLSGESTNTNFMVFGVTGSWHNPSSTTFEASMLTITPLMIYTCIYDNKCTVHISIPFQVEVIGPKTFLTLIWFFWNTYTFCTCTYSCMQYYLANNFQFLNIYYFVQTKIRLPEYNNSGVPVWRLHMYYFYLQ